MQPLGLSLPQYLSPSDATAAVRLALLDAGDYEISTKTGGANGSIVDKAPADVQSIVEKLRKAKADIDSNDENGNGAISWADLIYLAGMCHNRLQWCVPQSLRCLHRKGIHL